ncbi:hypothetical protein NDU88_008004 [Pleurodeles waltl]|uniref:Uncharacterized protein n=1 Tax=Pleurodeles waltl TaxID=8319 RepID=A0AAV7N3P4_PLEWA|nr:hypothetical protein NDU88_008004 [Pleurodeles waltl]
MGKSKRMAWLQGNAMELYNNPAQSGQQEMRLTGRGTDMGLDAHVVEPTRAELLPTIQGSREGLEGKIESVAIKFNLLSADLRKRRAGGTLPELAAQLGAVDGAWSVGPVVSGLVWPVATGPSGLKGSGKEERGREESAVEAGEAHLLLPVPGAARCIGPGVFTGARGDCRVERHSQEAYRA